MKSNRYSRSSRRSGLSLLEVTMACSLAALLMTSVVGMLHTSRQVWELSDNHSSRINSLHGTLRHVSRELRTAQSLLTLESYAGNPAALEFRDHGGQVQGWIHDPKNETVVCVRNGKPGVLAEHIHSLKFEGYAADAKTSARLASNIHCVRCTATVKLKKKVNEIRTAECWVWLRSQGQPNGPSKSISPPGKLVFRPAPTR